MTSAARTAALARIAGVADALPERVRTQRMEAALSDAQFMHSPSGILDTHRA